MLLPRAKQFIAESTVHSLSHLTGDRKLHVKLLWFAAFLTSLGFCTWRISELGRRFASREISTTVKANHLPFEFPDIYICSMIPISGSYSATMSPEDQKFLRRYRQLVNQSMTHFYSTDSDYRIRTFATRLAHTLPYEFVADKMGHNWSEQNAVLTYSDTRIDTFRHHSLINCAFLNWSVEDRQALESVNAEFPAIFFLDSALPEKLDRSEPDLFNYYGMDTMKLRPVDLDFYMNYYPELKSNSFNIFLVPRGQYPSAWDEHVIVGPGAEHNIVIKMEDVVYDETDFAGKCSAEQGNTIDFVNPYNGEKVTFKNSDYACRYWEYIHVLNKTIGCLIVPMPLPWELRNLTFCQNVTNGIRDASSIDLSQSDAKARQLCEARKPCRTRVYTHVHSSGNWPSEHTYNEFLSKAIARRSLNSSGRAPGLQHLVKNGSFEATAASLLLLKIRGLESLCTETRLSYAYSGNSLIADIGGMLGLFLGMSLLSVLELLELAHDCLLTVACRIRRQNDNSVPASAAEGAGTSAQSLKTLSDTRIWF